MLRRLSFFLAIILPVFGGECGLNRHTTIIQSYAAATAMIILAFGIALVVSLRSLASEDGEIRWFITRGLSTAQGGRRMLRGVVLLAFLLAASAAWGWYVSGLIAQYVPGRAESLVGVVTKVRPDLYRRQSCWADFDVQTSNTESITICFRAGFVFSERKLADALPRPGQRIILRLETNWFGTTVKRFNS